MREISHVGKTLLIVTGDFEKAAAIASDFENLGVFDIYLFPPTRKKPYESGKMDDLNAMVQRSEVLERLRDEKPSVIVRSEEHTSELQSRGHLVCRLLLEKKKQELSKSPDAKG